MFRVILFFLMFIGAAEAHDYEYGNLVIIHPTMTAPLPGAKVSAGYLVIENTGKETERLVGVSAGFAAKSQLHNMVVTDGIARMRPVKGGLEIPPGEIIVLEKGSYHLMFMQVSEPVEAGSMQPVKLLFEKAGAIEVELKVVQPGEAHGENSAAKPSHDDHSGHSD